MVEEPSQTSGQDPSDSGEQAHVSPNSRSDAVQSEYEINFALLPSIRPIIPDQLPRYKRGIKMYVIHGNQKLTQE